MKIERQYLPIAAICLSDKDATSYRAPLTHLLLERIDGDKGRLTAADGFMLAVVPVTMDADDVPGLVHPDALKAAAKDCPKRSEDVIVFMLADIVRSVGHACFPRTRGLSESDRYPDIARIIPRNARVNATERTGAQVAFNPEYLMRAHKALGGVGTVLWPTGPASPIVVTPLTGRTGYSGFEANGLPKLPYAAIMPMHDAGVAAIGSKESAA